MTSQNPLEPARAEEVERRFLFENLPAGIDDGVDMAQTYLDVREVDMIDTDISYGTTTLLERIASDDANEISSLLLEGAQVAFRIREMQGSLILGIKTRERPGVRTEWEWVISDTPEIRVLLASHLPRVSKTRYRLPAGGHLIWELDVFSGENGGLMIAEIELSHLEQEFDRPAWLGEEITKVDRYLNISLATTPFRTWSEK